MGHNIYVHFQQSQTLTLLLSLFAKHLSPIYCYDCFESYRQEGRYSICCFVLTHFQQPFSTNYLDFSMLFIVIRAEREARSEFKIFQLASTT